MVTFDRSSFLRGRLSNTPRRLPPPWAIAAFRERCTRCDACSEACPEGVLVAGRGGFPELRFEKAGCSFCGRCVEVCPTGALDRAGGRRRPGAARVASACLSTRGVACRLCEEACEARAIRFRAERGGLSRPIVDADQCAGCGSCVSLCPVHAIEVAEVP
jgi:ferredoxin-type protein NapF